MNAGAGRKRLETKAILTAGFTDVFDKYETKREMMAYLDAWKVPKIEVIFERYVSVNLPQTLKHRR